jgi:hypothetical protein
MRQDCRVDQWKRPQARGGFPSLRRVERRKMSRTELFIQLLKIAIGLAFGAYFVWWSLQVLDRLTPEYDAATAVVAPRIMKAAAAPVGSPWMWTLIFGHHEGRMRPTREDAMAASGGPDQANNPTAPDRSAQSTESQVRTESARKLSPRSQSTGNAVQLPSSCASVLALAG